MSSKTLLNLFCGALAGLLALSSASHAGTLVLEHGFENLTGQSGSSAPTVNYPFGTSYLEYWNRHDAGTDVISNCEGRRAYEGSNYLHLQFRPGADPCLSQNAIYQNNYLQFGQNFNYPTGDQDRSEFQDTVTSNTMIVRFYFRLTGDWSASNDAADNGGGLKFIRVNGNGRVGDEAGALIKLRLDGDSTDPRWNLYDPGTFRNTYFRTGVNIKDGNWHSMSFKVVLNRTDNSTNNVTMTFWVDDWDMNGPGHSHTVTCSNFGTGFYSNELFTNWSASTPVNPMGMDLDKLEVWDGLPFPPPSPPQVY
ncbi:MAG: hypothetical protein AB2598_08665 [Candidatus Thiodiazotropha sp.]